jgi:hypothetical protein
MKSMGSEFLIRTEKSLSLARRQTAALLPGRNKSVYSEGQGEKPTRRKDEQA